MAEKVKADNWKARNSRTHYPWNKWGDGDTWRIFHGRDYHSTQKCMCTTIRRAAIRVGMRATLQKTTPDEITFRFYLPEATGDNVVKLRQAR